MADVVLVGGGGHAGVLLDVLGRLGHRVIGFSAPDPDAAKIAVPYLGPDEQLHLRVDVAEVIAVIGLGKVTVDDHRMLVFDSLARAGLRFPPVVAPSATVQGRVALGDGSVVLDGAVIATGSRLGRICIVNTKASVDHDCVLGDDVHVAPGATVSGEVEIGDGGLVGAGATLVHGIRVCAATLIGAGATVVDDLAVPGTYVGTPARRR
jgi:sugar O-acyltransferase (sialic acid O-acetyltransferase NeuD family)